MPSDLNMSHRKFSGFVSFPLCTFTLVIKLRNFDFKGFFDKKIISELIMFCQIISELIMFCQTVSELV